MSENHSDSSMAVLSSSENGTTKGNWVETVTNIALLAVLYLFLFHYFKPDLLLSDTTTSGGDTVSHNLLAYHLKEGLLTKGKIIGWFPYSFAGHPLFQFYFPLLYLVAALLSFIIPFNVALPAYREKEGLAQRHGDCRDNYRENIQNQSARKNPFP